MAHTETLCSLFFIRHDLLLKMCTISNDKTVSQHSYICLLIRIACWPALTRWFLLPVIRHAWLVNTGLLFMHTLSPCFKLAWNLHDHQFVHVSARLSSLVLTTDCIILNENQTAIFLLIIIPHRATANLHTNIFLRQPINYGTIQTTYDVFHNTCKCSYDITLVLCDMSVLILFWKFLLLPMEKTSLCLFHAIGPPVFLHSNTGLFIFISKFVLY